MATWLSRVFSQKRPRKQSRKLPETKQFQGGDDATSNGADDGSSSGPLDVFAPVSP